MTDELPPGLIKPFEHMTLEELREAEEHWAVESEKLDAIIRDLRKLQKAVRAVRHLGYLPRQMEKAAGTWRAQREAEDWAKRAAAARDP